MIYYNNILEEIQYSINYAKNKEYESKEARDYYIDGLKEAQLIIKEDQEDIYYGDYALETLKDFICSLLENCSDISISNIQGIVDSIRDDYEEQDEC